MYLRYCHQCWLLFSKLVTFSCCIMNMSQIYMAQIRMARACEDGQHWWPMFILVTMIAGLSSRNCTQWEAACGISAVAAWSSSCGLPTSQLDCLCQCLQYSCCPCHRHSAILTFCKWHCLLAGNISRWGCWCICLSRWIFKTSSTSVVCLVSSCHWDWNHHCKCRGTPS